MAYNNKTPVLSRVDQGVRDNDFIPISELKEFDNKLAEIIKLFESTHNSDVNDANSLAKKIKDIEYNMADALIYDENNNIIGYNTITTEDGKEEPKYGENAIYNMLATLEKYYGDFVALMGSDPNIDNWKIDLDKYYTEAITLFKNKITGVFKNSAIAATLEAKNSKVNDYVLTDNIDIKKNEIIRLNPDVQSYIRNINLLPSELNTNFIAFEVGELEKDSLVFNLKIQNGFMWVNLNVILDKGKWYITREKVLGKELDNTFKINVFKYSANEKVFYVFCLYTDYPELDQYYNFEIEGLLVNGYSFNATGLSVDKHNKYYSYKLVEDKTVDPIYNETYYTKSVENYVGENDETLTREIYVPETHLIAFKDDVDYYTRDVMFSFIKSFDFINDELDGEINKDGILKDKKNQMVVEDIKYSGSNKAIKIDYEVSEALDDNEEADTNDYILNHNKLKVDDSVRLYNNGLSMVAVGKSPKKIDDRIAAAFGEEAFDIVDLRPGEIINTNAYLNRDISDVIYNAIHGNIERLSNDNVVKTIVRGDEIVKENIIQFSNGNVFYIDKDGTFYTKNKGWIPNKELFELKPANTDDYRVVSHNDKYVVVTCREQNDNYYKRSANFTYTEQYNGNSNYRTSEITGEGNVILTNLNLGKRSFVFVITENGKIIKDIFSQTDFNYNSGFALKDDKLFCLSGKGKAETVDTQDIYVFYDENGGGSCRVSTNPTDNLNITSDQRFKSELKIVNLTDIEDVKNIQIDQSIVSTRKEKTVGAYHPISNDYKQTTVNWEDHSRTIGVENEIDFFYDTTNGKEYVLLSLVCNECPEKELIYSVDFNESTDNVTKIYGETNNDRANFISSDSIKLLENTTDGKTHYFSQVYDSQGEFNSLIRNDIYNFNDSRYVFINKDNTEIIIMDEETDNLVVKDPIDFSALLLTDVSVRNFGKDKLHIVGKDENYITKTYLVNEVDKTFTEIKTFDDKVIHDVKLINDSDIVYISENKPYMSGDYYRTVETLHEVEKVRYNPVNVNENTESPKPDVTYAFKVDVPDGEATYDDIETPLIAWEKEYVKVDTDTVQTPEAGKTYYTIDDSTGEDIYTSVSNLDAWAQDTEYFTEEYKKYYIKETYSEIEKTTPDASTTYYSDKEDGGYTEHAPASLPQWEDVYIKVNIDEAPTPDQNETYYTTTDNVSYTPVVSNLTDWEFRYEKVITKNPDNESIMHPVIPNTTYYTKTILDDGSEVYEVAENLTLFDPNTEYFTRVYTDYYTKSIKKYYEKIENSIIELIPEATSSIRDIVTVDPSRSYIIFNNEIFVRSKTGGSAEIHSIIKTAYTSDIKFKSFDSEYDFVYGTDGKGIIATPRSGLIKIADFSFEHVEVPIKTNVTLETTENNIYIRDSSSLYHLQDDKTFEQIITDNKVEGVVEINDTQEQLFILSDSIVEMFKYVDDIDFSNFTSNANPNVYSGDKIYLSTNEVYQIDLIEDPTILDNLVKSNDPLLSKRISNINEYIKNNLVFNNEIKLGILKRSENTVDILIVPDFNSIANGEFYMLFTVNISTEFDNVDATEKVLVYRKLVKSEDEFIGKKILYQEKWTSIASNNIITVAIGKKGLFYSYNSDTFHMLINPVSQNTHEPIVFDDSFEVFYDGYKNFFVVKVDKNSTDHTYYYSDNGINWKKSNMDIIFPDLIGQAFYPRIMVSGINKTWFIAGKYANTIMVDGAGLEYITSYYTESIVSNNTKKYSNDTHTLDIGFACSDIFFNGEKYYALDITNNRFIYATSNETTTKTTEYITTWIDITVTDQLFTEPRIYDFRLYGYDLRGAILYGSGKNDPTTVGIWKAPWDTPGTFTKCALPEENIGVSKFYPCVSIWKNENGSETAKDIIFILATNGKTYKTEDFTDSWTEETGTHEVIHVGSFNNYYIIKNTDTGLVSGRSKDGIPTNPSDFTSKLTEPHGCMSRNLHNTVGYNILHVTDNKTGKILFTTDLEHWYPASVIGYNPIIELQDSGNRVVGNTSLYPIAINKDYDEAYCPTKDTNIHKMKYINDHSVYITFAENGGIILNIDDKTYPIESSEGINPHNFLVITTSNSKIRYCMISEYNTGIWISDEVEPGTFSGRLTKIESDIYVENGFQNGVGLFIYGKDNNQKTKLYFLSTKNINDGVFDFTEKLIVDFIDYIKPHNEDIIVSTYDTANPYDKYTYNNDINEFVKTSAIDITDTYSFNNTFEYNGYVYFINGSGSNHTVRQAVDNNEGVFQIKKILDTMGKIEYSITPFIKSPEIYKGISTIDKIYTGVLQVEKDKFILVASGKSDTTDSFITNKFIIDFTATDDVNKLKKIENITRYDNPVIYDINNIIETEEVHAETVVEQDRRGSVISIPSYGLIVQRHSFGCDINKLEDKNLSLDNKVDEYYFNRPNETISFNTYGVSGKTDFKLNSEKIAFAKTINTNEPAIIIALGQDNYYGIFDKDNKCVNVIRTGYVDRSTGQDIFVEFDPKYNNLQSVIIGQGNDELEVYGLFYGKFPTFNTNDDGERFLDYSKSVTVYKVFSIKYNELKNAADKIALIEEKNFTYDITQNAIRTELKNYIRGQNYIPSDDLNLTDTDLQIITINENIVYGNTYSLIAWNSNKKCLESYTKYLYDSSLDNPNEESSVNQKLSATLEGLDFDRTSLYVNIADPEDTSDEMVFTKYNDEENTIRTKSFVANLTNRKNLFMTSINDYKRDILFDSSKYLKYMQTRLGVFRYVSEDHVEGVNRRLGTNIEYNESKFNKIDDTLPKTYRNVEAMFYYTPEGSNSIIPIHIGNKGCVTNIWEVVEGIFIQTKEYIEYLYDEQEVYKLYKLIRVPDSNRSELISIHDTRYFIEMDTKYARIYDLSDTMQGTICVGTEPKGITDPNPGVDNNVNTGNSYIFWYNGNDFIIVKTFDMNTEYRKLTNILLHKENPLIISTDGHIYKYTQSTNLVEDITNEYESININTGKTKFTDTFNEIYNSIRLEPNYPRPIPDLDTEDNVLYIHGIYTNDASVDNAYLLKVNLDKKTMEVLKDYGTFADEDDKQFYRNRFVSKGLVRYPIVRPSDTTREYNSDLIDNIISQKIPVDKNLKVMGSLICDGVRFNVSAMRIETHYGINNKTFRTLVFNIDKYFRSDLSRDIFTETPGTIRFGYGEIDRNIQKMNIIIIY